ncbi:hypothetical protein [Pseudooceanicola aestuarii]|uniref:hypothetical protein n=1 Tax=Pseudooceanicola aestuarii TaxID=2697319 RepID=UPI0030841A69
MKGDAIDPKALIREAYAIEGISDDECRSILVDWALSLPEGISQRAALETLVDRHGTTAPDHPMTALLRAGMEAPTNLGRRGGRNARLRH